MSRSFLARISRVEPKVGRRIVDGNLKGGTIRLFTHTRRSAARCPRSVWRSFGVAISRIMYSILRLAERQVFVYGTLLGVKGAR